METPGESLPNTQQPTSQGPNVQVESRQDIESETQALLVKLRASLA